MNLITLVIQGGTSAQSLQLQASLQKTQDPPNCQNLPRAELPLWLGSESLF